ncbi:MAG: hypothetical protein UIH32_00365 [Streptococcus mutans]|uniref:NACHT domain-containing protein n=1 Tax=Streptococcus mutans TaxID=1309 RepID=UPI0002B5C95D|nr:hypothetical protein [Streptococcus mutans]EMC47557.1 hypothetical protein SMU103_08310 [Streptococcus mutans SA38]MDB8632222.1 hypothetical protein [Streptococcus mutans]MEE0812287.1 hypothetical protein [Streptococcus mutans]
MRNKLTWSSFEAVHTDVTDVFEQLCRILFKRQFLDNTTVLKSSPNHPGVEAAPIYSSKLNEIIAFQAKYFLNKVDYSQIQKSVNKTIENYGEKLDTFYLYCNKDLTLTSSSYKKIESSLKSVNINLEVISNNEILTQVVQYTNLQSFFFKNHTITKDWFKEYNQLSFNSLGDRYNSRFNVETKTDEKIQLFTRSQKAVTRINNKKKELIRDLYQLYSLSENTIISKIKNFINSLDDITVENLEEYLKWDSKLSQTLEPDLEKLSKTKDDLQNKLESDTTLSQRDRNIVFDKVRDIDRLLDYLYWFGCSEEEETLIMDKILVVTGEAGMGKSQLFATTVKEIMDDSGYALLLLGHHYISNDDISSQIIKKFGFNYGFYEFLDILDILGENENKSIYIFIDAVNETPTRSVWKNGLSRIISEINKRKHIKLVLSVRTGYEKLVFEENTIKQLEDREILRIIHSGFREESVIATKEFLNFHNIPFSPSDLLSYEMTNPLFLTLFCKTYNGEELNLFQMFERFISMVDEEIQKALNIPDSGRMLKDLLIEIAKRQLESDNNYLNKKELLKMEFWSDYGIGDKPFFLSHLLKSGLIIEHIRHDKEVYSFGYNLLEDYLKAKDIMDFSSDKEKLRVYIEKEILKIENGEIKNNYNIDVFLFVCCFYFEKFNEDCIDLIERVTSRYDRYDLANRYIKSFSWRPINTLSRKLFRNIANKYSASSSEVLGVLIENSTKENSSINAEFLHKILFTKKLNKRDSFWVPFINNLTYEEERIFQLICLFDEGNKIDNLSKEKLKLLLTLFTWLLASSNRKLRDVTSKAMIEILKNNFELNEYLLRKFETVNDSYIIQRLYGVVLGACTKRSEKYENEYTSLSQFIYSSVFNKKFVYPDILLRDYARLIVERFLFEFPDNKTTIKHSKIIPPYQSEPIPIVSSETYRDSDIKKDGFGWIDMSMKPERVGIYGDFGRYIFQSALNQFKEIDIENLYHYAMQYIRDELGYSNELFAEHDTLRGYPHNRGKHHHSIERIGKKYQWIAFYNILARISDSHKLKSWGNSSGEEYRGAWVPYVRDFDPTLNYHFMKPLDVLPKFNIEYDKDFIEELLVNNQQIDKWILQKTNLFDMPITYEDNNGVEWGLLYQHKEVKNQQEEISTNFFKFREGHQRIWRIIEAYFVKNSEFQGFKNSLQAKKFMKKNFSEEAPSLYQVFNREFAWSPSVKEVVGDYWFDYNVKTGEKKVERQTTFDLIQTDENFELVEKEKNVTIRVEKTLAKLLPAYIHFLWEGEYDASKKESISFNIPCVELINKLHLSQREYDGYFYSQDGDLVAFDGEITDTINGLIIRKDYLNKFLQENDLSIFWNFIGEKQYFTQSLRHQYYSRWNGFFWKENDSIQSDVELSDHRTASSDL